MADIKLNTANGSVTLVPEDGTGNVDISVPRVGFGKVLQVVNKLSTAPTSQSSGGTTPYQIADLTTSFTSIGSNSKYRIDIRWFGEISSGEFYNTVWNIDVNGIIVNRPTSDAWSGLTMATSTYTYTDTSSTPETLFTSTLYTSSIPASANVVVTVKANHASGTTITYYTNRCASTIGSNYETGSSEIIVTEIAN